MTRFEVGALFLLIGVLLIGVADAGGGAPGGYLAGIASELTTIEADVRSGVMPGLAGILLALVTIAVGVAVVGYFTRGR